MSPDAPGNPCDRRPDRRLDEGMTLRAGAKSASKSRALQLTNLQQDWRPMASFKLFLLPGDGIGPEVMAEVEKVVAFFDREGGARFETEKGLVGGCAYDAHGQAI